MAQEQLPEAADRITIHDLRCACFVGIRDWERKRRQPVSVDIEMLLDLRSAGRTDNIGDTVDYSGLASLIVGRARQTRYFLLEALAEEIADLCLTHSAVKRVKVAIWKRRHRRIYRKASVVLVRQR